ncbi:MAG: hypothetical protein ACRD10_10115 [Terriglobia bacterium]
MDHFPKNAPSSPSGAEGQIAAKREENAIYQDDRLVARVLEPQVDADAKEIRFAEIYKSDNLMLPDDCEYQGYRIVVRKVGYASKVEKESPEKGRILREVTAAILGYREQ